MAVGPASLVLRLPWHNHQAPRSVKRSVPSVRSSASATHFATSVSARSVFVESVRVMALSILSMVLSILLSSRSAESATHQPNSVTLMRPSCRWFGSLLVSYLRWRDAVEGCGRGMWSQDKQDVACQLSGRDRNQSRATGRRKLRVLRTIGGI